MSVSGGTRLGPYEIVSSLGAGGMGEVYRATDSRLKRQVAVKILPPALAVDADRLARFQREAEVLASLNHPHIATIYGLEEATLSTSSEQTGGKALIMELVEGPTLADRIVQGPIPIEEALPIARQIAEALEAAHEQGIIHRDLKPANIKVREDGTVKVLDFGLAKLADAQRGGRDDPSQSPTLTSAAMTGMGVILGSAAYMSPEQARGRPVDKRTDVWAFGAVLYEMLTGSRAFEGEDITETMAAVMKSPPKWTALPADVPPHVVTLIQRCLDRDRRSRIGDMAVARFLLSDHATTAASSVVAPVVSAAAPPRWRRTVPWVLAAAVAGVSIGWLLPRRTGGAPPPTHLQMSVAPADRLVSSMSSVRPSRTAIAISPDGRRVVFSATRGSVTQLYLKELDRSDATPIQGTEGATGPFFSPDGAWIGFWAGRTIKKVPAAGGPPAAISDVVSRPGAAATWSENGTIFFESDAGISRMSSAGEPPVAVTTPDASKGERHLLPLPLPGANALLFTSLMPDDWENSRIILHSLDSGERRVLITGGADARYVNTGHLVYMKTGTLMAVPFDVRSTQLTGAPVALIEGVMQGLNAPNDDDETGAGQFAVSNSGTLLYVTGGTGPMRESTMVWVDKKGVAQPLAAAPPGPYYNPRLSPDGQKVAVAVRRGALNRISDVWVYDVSRGTPTRLTFDGSGFPVWSPDGKRLVLVNLTMINADGSGKPQRLAPGDKAQFPSSWASTANMVAFLQQPQKGSNGIWVLPMANRPSGEPVERPKPRLFLESPFDLWHPDLSPDGRWMAYVSHESGNPEVYVQAYPGPGEKTRISSAWGFDPIWTANGRELVYRSFTPDTQRFFSATVRSVSPFRIDTPRLLFEAKAGEYDTTAPDRSWDVTRDGKRFLLLRPVASADKPVTTVHVVLDWGEEVKRRVPGN